MDHLKSLRDKKIIKKQACTTATRRLQRKLNNLIDDLHHKTVNYLTKNYNTIILPPFESQDMVRKNRSRQMNRDILQLKHYLFRQRLQSKCDTRNCHLVLHTEEYTTQTCGKCGILNYVGGNEMYHCSTCGLRVDRDDPLGYIKKYFNKVLKRITLLKYIFFHSYKLIIVLYLIV